MPIHPTLLMFFTGWAPAIARTAFLLPMLRESKIYYRHNLIFLYMLGYLKVYEQMLIERVMVPPMIIRRPGCH